MKEKGEIIGPINTFELDKLFQDYTLTKKSKIKQRDDDSYHFLGRYVKRYYKLIVEEKLNQIEEKVKLPKKVARFRKGTLKT